MKKISTIFCCLVLALLTLQLQAQENRFLTEVFDQVTVTNDVVYGVNATVLAFSQVGEAIPGGKFCVVIFLLLLLLSSSAAGAFAEFRHIRATTRRTTNYQLSRKSSPTTMETSF